MIKFGLSLICIRSSPRENQKQKWEENRACNKFSKQIYIKIVFVFLETHFFFKINFCSKQINGGSLQPCLPPPKGNHRVESTQKTPHYQRQSILVNESKWSQCHPPWNLFHHQPQCNREVVHLRQTTERSTIICSNGCLLLGQRSNEKLEVRINGGRWSWKLDFWLSRDFLSKLIQAVRF